MTTQVETSGNGLDTVKWLAAVLLLVAATLGNHYGADTVSPLLRIGGVVVLGIAALALALTTTKGKGFLEVLKEARIEARKIVWPSNAETWQTTLIVMAVVVVTSLLLWGIDSLFGWIVSAIIG